MSNELISKPNSRDGFIDKWKAHVSNDKTDLYTKACLFSAHCCGNDHDLAVLFLHKGIDKVLKLLVNIAYET